MSLLVSIILSMNGGSVGVSNVWLSTSIVLVWGWMWIVEFGLVVVVVFGVMMIISFRLT